MEFLMENRNIVILVAVLVIGYFLLRSEFVNNLYLNVKAQWASLSGTYKLVVAVAIVALAYYLWNREY
ncbi:hypothetical protein QKU48_gp0390 [Fadolivirus algeromassiliense]|jgi:hypothetical protein|uniref:Uncharacterized protein n=1 Tax=Fadolivirus FV1/VV64 TaxID=3070911 RepID=A0A7D3UPD8_9VIRU|nr:hypothetical protein QKU48_gp0390 [Fadolivirus algeromassiliense]QKF93848.1 hypothetical protein Fadolivirus_1_390 [Fadolivirus FV1/VV64]